jgi:DNA recombination protein RmuC
LDGELERADLANREALDELRLEYEQRLTLVNEALDRERRELLDQTGRVRELETLLSKERESATEKLKLIDQAQRQLSEAFDSLSRQALDKNSQSFLELAKTQLESQREAAKAEMQQGKQSVEALVKPLSEKLDHFGKAVQALEVKREGAYSGLSEQIKALQEAEKSLHGTAQELSNALRGKSQRWGSWGEMQLRRVVEMAGMLQHVDFAEQQVVEGGRDRPDMIVHLPNAKKIIVDSKAVTEAYMPVVEAVSDEERSKASAAYAVKVKRRLQELSQKGYWEQFEGSAEFVVMFLPGESFFAAALEADPTLIEFGAHNRVILATPTTLIALLRAVAYGWRQEQLADNAREISELGQELYERIRVMAAHFQRVGKNLGQATEAYNDTVGSLERRVLPQARKFDVLGAGGKDVIAELDSVEATPKALTAPDLLLVEGEQAGGSQESERRL